MSNRFKPGQEPESRYRNMDHPVWNRVERFVEPFSDTDRQVLPKTAWGFILYFATQARGPFIILLIVGGLVGGVDAALYWSVGWLIDILDSSTPATLLADHWHQLAGLAFLLLVMRAIVMVGAAGPVKTPLNGTPVPFEQ